MLSASAWEKGLPAQFARAKVLYSDEFCKLTEDVLVIKRFFFGTLRPKVVLLKDLKVVYFDEQRNAKKYTHRRIWGRVHDEVNNKHVYWAADFKR